MTMDLQNQPQPRKNLPTMKRHTLTLTGLLALYLAVPAGFAAEPPAATPAAKPGPSWGAVDVQPTPEHPVYFRHTFGYYPGATPPLEWWEGTPTTKKVTGVFGNPPRRGEVDALDFADTKSKNILWKAPVPGWGLSHPIVVGKKIFAVGEPDFVTCWDLDTGKQLWQRRIMPLLCDGLSDERAAAGQKVLDLARALWLITGGGSTTGMQPGNLFSGGWSNDRCEAPAEGTSIADFVADKRKTAELYLKALAPHRADVEAFGDAALLAALDKDLDLLKRYQAVADYDAFKALHREKKPGTHHGLRPLFLVDACLKVLGVHIGGYWWGYVGTADSTLASDGQRIYGVFDQGQVFALELDGKIVWLQREKGSHDNRGSFHRSPLLCGDLLLVRNVNVKGSTRPLRALDVKTGQVRWEAPLAGSNYTVPRLMRLPGADGKPVDVLIGDAPQGKDQGLAVLRVSDGKLLGCLPPHGIGRGAVMAVFGQQVTWGSCDDRGGGPTCSYRLRLEGADTVVAEKVFVLEGKERVFGGNQGDFPTVAGTAWLYGNQLYDATTGALISKLPVPAGSLGVIAGHHLIGLSGGFNDGLYGRGGPGSRNRDDHMVSCQFTVIDLKDPAKPVVAAKNNLLGYKEPTADLIVSTYFKEFNPMDFAGCYKGAASYFMLMGGPVPAGNKLLVQSTAYLYCIGPALRGAPGDDPATVQAIRAAKPAELATYLASPSALYRHTAVTAMITAGIGGAKDVLTKLVGEDPYEEIRAAAILALNAAEPDAAPGTQALLPLMTAAWAGGNDDGRFERRALQRALEVLGKKRGTPLLVAAFTKTQDEPTRQSIIDFAAVLGWAAPELTRQAEAYLAFRCPNVLAVRYLGNHVATDEEIREALKRAYPTLPGSTYGILAATLGQVLEVEEKIAFLLHCIRANLGTDNWRRDYRAPFLRQLGEMGREGTSAIPELEKTIAAHAHLADEFAPVIAALKGR